MAASHNPEELHPGTVTDDGQRIVRALGSGQMGQVYEALRPDGSTVALKMLRAGTFADATLIARFQREARLCSTLQSPHVVPVLGFGLHQGRPFLVMRLLRGSDLDDVLTRTGPLRPDVAVAIALQACAGLEVAHASGVVHRDLKPANIFLDRDESGLSTVIVCDFGVAKIIDEDGALTASGAVLGTPLYMAPEQLLDSKRVDARCDVWAIAMTLYHALAGRTAWDGVNTIGDLVMALSAGVVPPLQRAAPWVSPALARVVHSALLPRERRIPTIAELAGALRHWAPVAPRLDASALTGAPPEMRVRVATIATLPNDHRELGKPDDATVAEQSNDAQARPDALLGKTLGEKYRLVRRIGYGGMGAVYEAVDASQRHMAVKVMHSETAAKSSDASRRFTREMSAVRAIASPHVVKPLDFGVDEREGIPFFVMELLSGNDLATVIQSIGPVPPEVAVELFVQAAEALGAAHALGIVHRDVKPSNLFLHEPGNGDLVLKVCDFGIAKRVEGDLSEASTELTRTGGLLGSPLYMSPEHARNAKNVDERSDIWSLGLSLHETLSGERPWRGRSSIGEVILAICTESVVPLATCAPWVDPGLARAVEGALTRDADARWPSAAAFADAIRPFGVRRPLRTSDLTAIDAHLRSKVAARADRGTRSPGMITSGSLAAGARNLEASVVLPMQRGASWKWAAVAGAFLLVGGGGLAIARRSTQSGAAHDPSYSAAITTEPPPVASTAPVMSGAPASAESSPPPLPPAAGASASDGGTAAQVAAAAPGRARPRPPSQGSLAGGPAPTMTGTAVADPRAQASPPTTPPSPPPVASQGRKDGRASSRKDDQ